MPVSETYQVEMAAYKNMENEKLLFNPILIDRQVTNPFKLAERSYPVDWGMPSERRFILTMHLPDNYTIESGLKPLAIALPNQGGRFVTSYEAGENQFVYSYVNQFSKSIYSPEEYPYLKELYNRMILEEKSELVFKRK